MQNFVVPQFIDTEDKILGPITPRQFVIVMIGFVGAAIFYKIFDFALFVTVSTLELGLCAILAFMKINGRPFHFFILNVVQTLRKPRLRIWHHFYSKSGTIPHVIKSREDEKDDKKEEAERVKIIDKDFSRSRLSELSLAVDTMGVFSGQVSHYQPRVSRKLDAGKTTATNAELTLGEEKKN